MSITTHNRTLGDTYDIPATLTTAPAGVTVYAPLSSASEIVLALVHETSKTRVVLVGTATAITVDETGECTFAVDADTFAEPGVYRGQVRVTWGSEVRHYPEPAASPNHVRVVVGAPL